MPNRLFNDITLPPFLDVSLLIILIGHDSLLVDHLGYLSYWRTTAQ